MSGEKTAWLFVHVEEPSMETALAILLPRIVGTQQIIVKIVDHGSKQRLLKDLPARLRGYGRWLSEDVRVLVLVDRDDADCHALKNRLEAYAFKAGLATKTNPDANGRFRIVNRIVVEELEAWFFGDFAAVCAAYPRLIPRLAKKARYRNPDNVAGGTWEALLQLLSSAGYYTVDHLPKIEVARRITSHMNVRANRSHSFQVFVSGLQALPA